MSEACTNCPVLDDSDWDTIKGEDWNNGGWDVGGDTQTWICRDNGGAGGWVLRTDAQGFSGVLKCTMSEDDFNIIKDYDMDSSTHLIDVDGEDYCITFDSNNNTAVPAAN